MKRIIVIIFILLLSSNLFAETGKQAASLSKIKWISGTAFDPSKPDGKSVYIIEFWATWCVPCRETIPHLNKLSDKYKDKNVIIIGITNEKEEVVKEFLKTNQMKYNIGLDTTNEVSSAYMPNPIGIPQAFIVDKTGLILWEGHPMEIEKPVQQVLNGTYNIEKSKQLSTLKTELSLAYQQGRGEDVLSILNKLMEIEPDNIENYQFKVYMLRHLNRFSEIPPVYSGWEKAAENSYIALHIITKYILQETNLTIKDIDMALRCAEKAAVLSERKDSEVLYTLAEAYFAIGLIDKTIETDIEALKVAKPHESEYLKAALDYYNKLVLLRNKIKNSETLKH